MRREALDFLRCPACHGALEAAAGAEGAELEEGELRCGGCGRRWPVQRGLPQLVFPEELEEKDAHSRDFWDRIARFYDWSSSLTAIVRGIPEPEERRSVISQLELRPGDTVLEVATGTGSNLKVIADQVGEEVMVFGLDLSPRMLNRAAHKLRNVRPPAELVLGNAMSLPFADSIFDAVLDGAGTKYFSDKGRTIREMLRVIKPGGKVVITDLGLPPGKRRSFRQRLLLLWIPGFREGPPLDVIPGDVNDLKVEWDKHETAYTVEFRKPVS